MKNLFFFAISSVLLLSSCGNSMNETEKIIFAHLIEVANDPKSIELVDYELVQTQTISDIYERTLSYGNLSDDEQEKLLHKQSEFSENQTEVSYCYKVRFRGKNAMGAMVANDIFILFDSEMKVISQGDGLLGLNQIQMNEILMN